MSTRSNHESFTATPEQSSRSHQRALRVAGSILAVTTAVGLAGCGNEAAAKKPETHTSASPTPTTPSPSIETSPSASASPTIPEVGPLGYDPMTYKGFSQEHPATVADFHAIPKDATPAEIIKDWDNVLNMIVASDDDTLWAKVRGLYVDSRVMRDGSTYGMDAYVDYEFTPANSGAADTSLGLGPSVLTDTLSAKHAPRFVTGSGETPIALLPASEKTVGWNNSEQEYVTIDIKPERTLTMAYKTDLVGPDGKKTAGWVEADPGNYGVTP